MKKVMLAAKNLTVGYPSLPTPNILFSDLNLELKSGELVCFMGPNGIGKSTLIRTLAGLQQPLSQQGLNGVDPKKISVVLTDRINAVNMTVMELITYGRYPYLDWNVKLGREDTAMLESVIELTRIQHLISKKLYALSDGQLQMVMIARALVQDTPIIILDEPTAHLDLNNRVEIMNLLRTLSRTQQKAILVATHELDLALQTADVVWLAADQKIISGVPEDLVLSGSFDEVFRFKGFDLKTGRVFHENFRNTSIKLAGEGHSYLWTRNALERCGYEISEQASRVVEVTEISGNSVEWLLEKKRYTSLHELLQALIQN